MNNMLNGIGTLLTLCFLLFIPLAIWKMVDIAIWLCHHVSIR
jgi:hypothetical protein